MRTRVFLASTKPLEDPVLYDRLYAAASETRKKKIDRCRFLSDRMQLLAAESLLQLAWREAGRPADAFSYAYGRNGKPYFPDAPELHFSLSHSGEYAMLAVSDAEIGCDIERIRHVRDGVARRILTPEEYAALPPCGEPARDEQFTRFWVAKESCFKACGEGIFAGPASVRIETEPALRAFRDGIPLPYAMAWGEWDGYFYAVCRAGALPAFEPEKADLTVFLKEDDR